MSSNISGFQGVKTPLQSMTNGQYTLADYTNMNRTLGARIAALEAVSAFNPNNVTIGGFLNIQSNSTNPGNLAVTNNTQISGSLQVNKTATINQNLNVAGNLVVGGAINFVALSVNNLTSTNINNSGTVTSTSFAGNGSALTGVLDNTKLPLTGGTISGALDVVGTVTLTGDTNSTGNITASGTGKFIGDGSLLTTIPYTALTGIVPTWNQNTTGNAATATNVPYSGLTGTIPTWNQNTTGNAATATNVAYSGLTGTVPTWNQNTTGNAATATSVTNLSGGTAGRIPYQSNTNTTLFTAVGTAGQVLTSQGTGAPTWTAGSTNDPTKMPLAGGIFTGPIQGFQWNAWYSYDQAFNQVLTPPANIISTWDQVWFNYSNNCTLNMTNFTSEDNQSYPDEMRKITITKRGMSAGDFTVNLQNPPPGYTFQTPTLAGANSLVIPLGTYSVTFLIKSTFTGSPGFMLIAKV